jgi:hypothetical protein
MTTPHTHVALNAYDVPESVTVNILVERYRLLLNAAWHVAGR